MKVRPEISDIIIHTIKLAETFKHGLVTSDHVFLAIVNYPKMKNWLDKSGVLTDKLIIELINHVKNSQNIPLGDTSKIQCTNDVQNTLLFPIDGSDADAMSITKILHTLASKPKSMVSYYVQKYGIDTQKLIEMEEEAIVQVDTDTIPEDEATKILASFCTNITESAKEGKIDPLVGRVEELKKITKIMAKRNKRNVILVGEAGVGKTALAEGLALNIINGNVPKHMQDHIVWGLDIGDLLAGSRFRGEFEERIKNIFSALKSHGKSILFIDEAHQMKDAGTSGGAGGPDFANMIKPLLTKGKVKVIASTTWSEYTANFEKDQALMRRFVTVRLSEPSIAEAKLILFGLRKHYEEFHGGKISDAALDAAVEYSAKYITDRQLPDKAIDLIDSACATVKSTDRENWTVEVADIAAEITADRGIKVEDLNGDVNESEIIQIGQKLNDRIFDQDKAIGKIASRLISWKAGMKDPQKPVGSFMFIGPSGVGKTQTAKEISKLLGMKLIHYNMSEYQEKHSLSTLIGAPPGYVGHGNGKAGDGLLINDIIKNPNSIILFDEMAGKAHPDVCNILLQMADEGVVTSMSGRSADCKNCVIILSGNLGAQATADKRSLGYVKNDSGKSETTKAIEGFFLPELLGRFTVVHFGGLDQVSLRKIVLRSINELSSRPRMTAKKLQVLPSDNLVDHFINKNQNQKHGARPYKSDIEETIVTDLGVYLLQNPTLQNTTIELDWVDNTLTINQINADSIAISNLNNVEITSNVTVK
jgi:ATP-dependent Clp protease ATP-binding subunit ClpA